MLSDRQTKRHSRFLCALLVFCFLISLSACSEAQPEETSPSTGSVPAEEIGTETEPAPETEVNPSFEEADYGGRDFTVFAANDFVGEIYAEEQTGSVANDVIYARNLAVEDLYNVRFTVQAGERDNSRDFPKLTAMVTAGEGGIDLLDIHAYKAHNLILKDCLMDWNGIPGTDMAKPWWLVESNEASTFFGKLYAAGGSLNLTSLTHDWCMFYNPAIVENVGIGVSGLQETVIGGKWTLDAFEGMVRDVYFDLDGNGQRDMSDQYGFVAFWSTLDPMFTAAGESMTDRDDEGNLIITFMSEQTVDLYNKWYSIIFEQEGVYPAPESWQMTIDTFLNGTSMIIPGVINFAYQMADMEDGYGIIPYPKWNEQQEKYYTMPVDSASILGVLITADLSDHCIGNVVEALNYYSWRDVFPAYYDILLKGRYSLDQNTATIIDMFIPNAKYEFAVQFSENSGPPLYRLSYFTRDLVHNQTADIVSAFKRIEESVGKGVESIMEHYR